MSGQVYRMLERRGVDSPGCVVRFLDGNQLHQKAAKREADTSMAQENAKPARKRSSTKKVDGLTQVLDNIAAMPEHDRAMATRFHEIVARVAPSLTPRLWYGMPAYARDGKVLCFFQSADKFKARYATFGFEEQAALDEGAMWPTSYALLELGDAEDARIEALIQKAMGQA